MVWVIGVAVLAVIVLLVNAVKNRRPDVGQLGSVSSHWVAEHRLDER